MKLCLAERNHKYCLLIIGVCIPPIHLNHFQLREFYEFDPDSTTFFLSLQLLLSLFVIGVTIYVYVATAKWSFQSSWQ